MVRGDAVPLTRAAFDNDQFIIRLIEYSKGNAGANGDTEFVLSHPEYRAETEAAAAAENRTIDDPAFRNHLIVSINRWKKEAINDPSRPALAKYRKAPRRRRQNAGGAAALGQPNTNGNNNAVPAAAAPSNVVPSNGHVQPIQPQQPMGVAMAYAQQQALQAAQQQQRHQP